MTGSRGIEEEQREAQDWPKLGLSEQRRTARNSQNPFSFEGLDTAAPPISLAPGLQHRRAEPFDRATQILVLDTIHHGLEPARLFAFELANSWPCACHRDRLLHDADLADGGIAKEPIDTGDELALAWERNSARAPSQAMVNTPGRCPPSSGRSERRGQAIFSGRVQSAKLSPTMSSQEPSRAVLMPARRASTGSTMPLAISAIWFAP